jgi:hypothetical protein
MRYVWIAGSVAALALTIGVQPAMAGVQVVQRTDPSAESPAGVIYQIPLDSARRDAAPVLPTGRRDGGTGHSATSTGGPGAGAGGSGAGGAGGSGDSTGAGGAGQGGSGPAGSSGGASAHGAGTGLRASAGSEAAGGNGGTAQDPSSIHSENGFGSSSQVPGVSEAALRTGAGVASAQTAGSIMPTYLLIALVATAAIGMGLLATRHSHRHRGARPPAGSQPPAGT